MQKNVFQNVDVRFSSFLFTGLLIALLVFSGCSGSQPPAPPSGGGGAGATSGGTTATPFVEPMEPAGGLGDGAFMLKSAPFAKVAQQAVPLPPPADLVAQADDYLSKIESTLKDLYGTIDYKRDAEAVVRDANGLALVALAIGLSLEDSKYKKAAPGIIEAALALEKVDKLDVANKAYADLNAAFESSCDPSTLGWTKVAALVPAMKAVPNLDSAAKRLSNTEARLKRGSDRVAALLAGLAAIGQGTIANLDETLKPDAGDEWRKECELFRDAAIKANAAVHSLVGGSGTYADFDAAYKELADTCDSCHKIFQP